MADVSSGLIFLKKKKYPTDFTIRKSPVTLTMRSFNDRRNRDDGEPDFTALGNE